MKKTILLAAISITAIFLFAGCGGSPAAETGASAQQAAGSAENPQQTTDETITDETSGTEASVPVETTVGNVSGNASSENTAVSGSPTVYFTSDISAEGLVMIYEALGWTPSGKTAVKISTGEPPASVNLDLWGSLWTSVHKPPQRSII